MAGTTTKAKTIYEALAAFQAELPKIDLDGTNPHFKSKYATLGNVTKNVFPKLAEHGFSFTTGSFVDNGVLVLDAHLLHESGESRSMQFPITETNPQKVGSAVTYYRRYALAALTGVVADEDDDGNAASRQSPDEARVAAAKSTPQPSIPKPAAGDSAQSKIQKWINEGSEGWEARRDQANAARETIMKKGNLKGQALFEAIAKEVLPK